MELISLLCLLMIIGTITCEDKGFVRLVARVGEDVVLPCSLSPEKNIELDSFDWRKDQQDVFLYTAGIHQSEDPQFKGRVSHFPNKLKNGNASIIIRNIKLSDSGNYSCYFPSLQQQRFHVELSVGASAKPRVMILNMGKDWALLQCEIRGAFPKPQISWIDSDGTVLPATEKLDYSDGLHYPPALTLQTTVTKTGIFHCRVAQEELNHTTEVQISIPVLSDETVTGSREIHLFAIIGCFNVIMLGLTAVLIFCRMRRRRSMRAARHDSGVSSLHSSHYPTKPEERREPDEALRIPLEEV